MRWFLPLFLLTAPVAGAEPAPAPKRLPDESGFPAALRAAVSPHFEYSGCEPGIARGTVRDAEERRFWFAKVRAKTPGVYRVEYSTRPDGRVLNAFGQTITDVDFQFRIYITKAGTPRLFDSGVPGPYNRALPTANVGDTLLLPVFTGAGLKDHRFLPVEKEDELNTVPVDFDGNSYRVLQDDYPAARMTTPDHFTVINSWRMFDQRRVGGDDMMLHAIGAYLEFATPGTFDFVARLSDEPAGAPGRSSLLARVADTAGVPIRSIPIRVMPRNQPVTVVLNEFRYMERSTGGSSGAPAWIEAGTLEARVGDTVVVDCGLYATSGPKPLMPERGGVVEALPFRDVRPYELR